LICLKEGGLNMYILQNNNKLIFFNLIVLLTILSFSVKAQDIVVSASLNTNKIKIGKQAQLSLKATAAKGIQVVFPEVKDTLTEKIEVVNVGKVDTLQAGNLFTYKREIIITAFDSGYFAIPPFKFQIRNDSTKQFETEALLFAVQTIPVDTTLAIKSIKAPIDPAWSIFEIQKEILIGFVGLLAVIVIVYFLMRKKKVATVLDEQIIKRPAHEIAIEALTELRTQKLWQQGRAKEFHIIISDIVRTYIEQRFSIGAMEMTSDEILKSLRLILTNQQLKIKLSSVLILSDMVKFAKENPLPNENELSWEYAMAFVKETALVKHEEEEKI
jgi:hypothetical protein